MSLSIPRMIPLTVPELKTMSEKFGFDSRLLSEAQEVMLRNGMTPEEVRKELPLLCQDAIGQGHTVDIFNRLMLGIISVYQASR